MKGKLPPYWISVCMTITGEPQHWLRRAWNRRGRLMTSCGNRCEDDGLGLRIVRRRDGNKVDLLCPDCAEHLRDFLSRPYTEQQGELFGE